MKQRPNFGYPQFISAHWDKATSHITSTRIRSRCAPSYLQVGCVSATRFAYAPEVPRDKRLRISIVSMWGRLA